jgi:hypothetical protein
MEPPAKAQWRIESRFRSRAFNGVDRGQRLPEEDAMGIRLSGLSHSLCAFIIRLDGAVHQRAAQAGSPATLRQGWLGRAELS